MAAANEGDPEKPRIIMDIGLLFIVIGSSRLLPFTGAITPSLVILTRDENQKAVEDGKSASDGPQAAGPRPPSAEVLSHFSNPNPPVAFQALPLSTCRAPTPLCLLVLLGLR